MSLTLHTTIQEATMAAELAIQYLQKQCSDSSFGKFYSQVLDESQGLPSSLPRFRRPKQIDNSIAAAHAFASPADYFQKQYFEVLDLLINEL